MQPLEGSLSAGPQAGVRLARGRESTRPIAVVARMWPPCGVRRLGAMPNFTRSDARRSTAVVGAVAGAVVGALVVATGSAVVTAAPATAKPWTPVPACAGAKNLVVDVTQDVENQPFLPARDGHMWANFSYRQHVRIWRVGAREYCVRKDLEGTWVSHAGASPGLTGTISDGLTGTFTNTTYWDWTGKLTPIAPVSGYLGTVHADCTDVGVCADDAYLVVDKYYFPQGTQHCNSVRLDTEVDGGDHGHISLTINGDVNRVDATGDITG